MDLAELIELIDNRRTASFNKMMAAFRAGDDGKEQYWERQYNRCSEALAVIDMMTSEDTMAYVASVERD